MNIFFSDLDNTLIYSHRVELNTEKTVVEYLNGKEQSYVTNHTLKALKNFCAESGNFLVPVTTRNIEQYNRLSLLKDEIGYKDAIVLNGAILLKDGKIDEEWQKASLEVADKYFPCLKDIYNYLGEAIGTEHLHFNEPYMVFMKVEEGTAAEKKLTEKYSPIGIDKVYSSGKLYFLPSVFNKGSAIKRYLERFANCGENINVISAGDSVFDIPMAQYSALSFYRDTKETTAGGVVFSDEICRILTDKYCTINKHKGTSKNCV